MRQRLPDILGIPVWFDDAFEGISDSRGFLWWKGIFVGQSWTRLTRREQGAVLLHEAGHVKLWHAEKRILPSLRMHFFNLRKIAAIVRAKNEAQVRSMWGELLKDSGVAALAREQEFEADRFCAGCGYGSDLAMAFSRMQTESDPMHPPTEERLLRLNPMGGRTGI